MIFDQITHLKKYSFPYSDQILEFISTQNCLTLADGQMDIVGANLFVKIMNYEPKAAQDKKFETHRMYADLQYIVSGIELMQVAPAKSLIQTTEYDAQGDYQFFDAHDLVTDMVVEAGQFVIFYPGEAHKPSCLYQNNKNKIKKLVFKIRI